MKITQRQLRTIVKQELSRLAESVDPVLSVGIDPSHAMYTIENLEDIDARIEQLAEDITDMLGYEQGDEFRSALNDLRMKWWHIAEPATF